MNIASSERLRYQLIGKDDAEFLYQLDKDPAVMKYLNGGKASTLEHIVDVWIPRMENYLNPAKGWGLWKVETLECNESIGWILLRPMDFFSDSPKFNDLEIGWRFMQASWGKGYATEAANHVAEKVLENQTDVDFLSAIADKENRASIAIMKKMNMAFMKEEPNLDPAYSAKDVVYYQKALNSFN